MNITENRKQYATILAFDMLRGEDFHGLTAKQITFLRGVVSRAYPDSRSGGETSWKTIRWNDGTSEWALSWWSRSGGGGQLVNVTIGNARDSHRRKTELRATKLESLERMTKGTAAFVEALHANGAQFINMVSHYAEASRREPSLRRQIQWAEATIAQVEAQRDAAVAVGA